MISYRTVEEKLWDQEIGPYTAFGICAYQHNGLGIEKVKHISDVFLNREDAEGFVRNLNAQKLSLVHLADAVEDALHRVS